MYIQLDRLMSEFFCLNFCLLCAVGRLITAIENLQRFSISADPSFLRFHVDISRELKLISSINFIQGCYQIHQTKSILTMELLGLFMWIFTSFISQSFDTGIENRH